MQVAQLPETDELSWTRKQLLARLNVCMGGRAAEEMIFGQDNITSGKHSLLPFDEACFQLSIPGIPPVFSSAMACGRCGFFVDYHRFSFLNRCLSPFLELFVPPPGLWTSYV